MSELRIALPGGKQAEKQVLALFKAAGMEILRAPHQYRTSVSLGPGPPHECVFMRPRDIPREVALGHFDIGFCGWDRFYESGADAEMVAELLYQDDEIQGSVEVVLFGAANGLGKLSRIKPNTTVVSEYPNCTAQFFDERGISVEVQPCSGAAEALVPYPYPYGVCVRETGETLKRNKLKVLEVILESTLVLVASRSAMDDVQKVQQINALVRVLKSKCVVQEESEPASR